MVRLFCLALFVSVCVPQGVLAQQERLSPEIWLEKFQDWTYRCVSSAQTAKPACELSQSVQIEQDGQFIEVLNFALSPAEDKAGNVAWALIVLTPQDVHLPSDFGLSFGGGNPILTRYRNCNQLGCWVVIPANDQVLSGLKRALDGAGHMRLLDGQVVKVVFSLRGFTAGFNALAKGELPSEQGN